jgi:hypothetical protein
MMTLPPAIQPEPEPEKQIQAIQQRLGLPPVPGVGEAPLFRARQPQQRLPQGPIQHPGQVGGPQTAARNPVNPLPPQPPVQAPPAGGANEIKGGNPPRLVQGPDGQLYEVRPAGQPQQARPPAQEQVQRPPSPPEKLFEVSDLKRYMNRKDNTHSSGTHVTVTKTLRDLMVNMSRAEEKQDSKEEEVGFLSVRERENKEIFGYYWNMLEAKIKKEAYSMFEVDNVSSENIAGIIQDTYNKNYQLLSPVEKNQLFKEIFTAFIGGKTNLDAFLSSSILLPKFMEHIRVC